MTEYHFFQVDAASVVAVGVGTAYTPKRLGHEPRDQAPVILPLVEGRSQIVTLEVRENVSHEKVLSLGEQFWERLAVVRNLEERCSSCKETVEDPLLGIVARF